MSDETNENHENQTELYHFANGVFVGTDWFPGDLDENNEAVRVSKAGRFPESYFLTKGDWEPGPLVPGDDPPYEGVNLLQTLYGAFTELVAILPVQLDASPSKISSDDSSR